MGVGSFVYLCSVITVLLSGGFRVGVNSEPIQDKQALIAFITDTPHADRVDWNASTSACDWVGIECDANRSFVYSLRLPGVGLVGPIPPNSLGRLAGIRVLSLRSNRLTGSIPSDFSNLKSLRNLYLQGNEFSGEFPPSLTALNRLARLDLSTNNFTGPIPFAVNNLSRLTGLFLQHNAFSGALPSISAANLTAFNVSDNKLNGSIPATLVKFPNTSFAGNLALCGGPLPPCDSTFFPAPSESPSPNPEVPLHGGKSRRLSTGAIVGIVIGASVGLILLVLLLIFCCRKRERRSSQKTPKPVAQSRAVPGFVGGAGGAATAADAGTSSSKDDLTGESGETERNRLVFFGGGMYSFDLEDLLRASAEVLGKGSVGTSYKAVLEQGITVVVKRLKDVVVSKKEFDSQMETLGNVKHENVVPLRAFYFSKDEKLLVYDFMPAGSLSALLHGSRGSGRTPLDWESRMRIAVGSARGLTHLHSSEKITHGNIKSSNILLRRSTTTTTNSDSHHQHDACLSDFGLHSLFGSSAPPNRVAGYRAPEVLETRKATFKSDVYSFGVLLLELLTGKAPNQASLGEEGIDLPRWVQSVVREEWTAEVFDVELMRYHNIEEEMVQLLQIAMSCVSTVPEQRPSMPEVLRMIEDVSRSETDDGSGLRQSSDDPSKGSDGHTPPPEPRTPPSSVTP